MQESVIRIEGAEAIAFRCRPDDTILAGALRSGLGFPYECNSGGCGACQFELVDGNLSDRWPLAPGISLRQRDRGRRLACQRVPNGDCSIKVRLDPRIANPIAPESVLAWFESSRALTADLAEFSFRTEGPARFRPGQFAMLQLPGVNGARAYSMSNLANDDGIWRFIIKQVPGGEGTAVLFAGLKIGGEVRLDGPFGNSYLRTGNDRDIVCIAGGSGISPVMSILRGIAIESLLDDRRVLLFHGGRGPTDMCAPALLAEDGMPVNRVELHQAISDSEAPDAADWKGARGMIHELVRDVLGGTMAAYDYYFCGPPPMTDAVHRMLVLEAQVPADQLYFDRFF